jgi:maltose/moltooligosaccharide transporter
MMGPFRALLSDLTSHKQQSLAQTVASFFQSCGQIIGVLVSSAFTAPLLHIELIFMIAYVSMACIILIACFFATERQNTMIKKGSTWCTCKRGFVNIYIGARNIQMKMVPIIVIQALTWFAWFCFMQYATSWFSQFVLGYDTDSSQYEEGVAMGSRALVYQAVVQLIFSFCCPLILKFVPLKWTYMFCLGILAACLFVAGFVREYHVANLVIALIGIPLAATNIFPFAVVGRLSADESKKGLLMGILNVFIVIPQLIDTTYTGVIIKKYGIQYVMICGACWATLATAAVFFIRTNNTTRPDSLSPKIDETIVIKAPCCNEMSLQSFDAHIREGAHISHQI